MVHAMGPLSLGGPASRTHVALRRIRAKRHVAGALRAAGGQPSTLAICAPRQLQLARPHHGAAAPRLPVRRSGPAAAASVNRCASPARPAAAAGGLRRPWRPRASQGGAPARGDRRRAP
jgi:hypothetical protein